LKLFSWVGRGNPDTGGGGGDGVAPAADPLPGAEVRLLAAARRGDRAAFDALVAPHREPLRKFLSRRVAMDALDDVTQEAMVSAWLALPEFESRARFRTWLYQIALHKAADWGRAHARRSGQEAPVPVGDVLPAEESGYRAAECRETVRAVLEGVPPAQREVIELYYFAEMTLPEIAALLGRNLNTVKYQFYRAHALAAEALRRGEAMAFGGDVASSLPVNPATAAGVLLPAQGGACEA
jgi:RNA polymerase sigma-70 factor (ECF subfamily)